MLCRNAIVLVVGLSLPSTWVDAQIVINELSYDDSGADDHEFVELFNAGSAPVDVSQWFVATGSNLGTGGSYSLPRGTTMEPRSYFVIGNPNVPGVNLPLVQENLFSNGPGYMVLVARDNSVVDSVFYEANKGTNGIPAEALTEGGIWGNHVLVESTRLSWQRWFDGHDTDRNESDFGQLPWTPGTTNDRDEDPEFANDFEDGAPGDAVDGLPGSFVPARLIEPDTVSDLNPSAIPESPDGGQAMIAWDPAGGGNFVLHDAKPVESMMFEAWVYLDANPELADERETWSIGLRGTSGAYFNLPLVADANGNSGVTWTYEVSAAGANLHLIDEGFAGLARTRSILVTYEIVAGQNDGWQRLRLEVDGSSIVGRFGGEYDSTDSGELFEGTLREPGIGSFYIGYREDLADLAATRPPTLDRLEIRTLTPRGGPRFERGNSNADPGTDLSDAVYILSFLFLGGPAPPCDKAADVDDDGVLNLTDAVFLLGTLFLGSEQPPAPYGECGEDPTVDTLGCAEFERCG
jgi:hypothetical protein